MLFVGQPAALYAYSSVKYLNSLLAEGVLIGPHFGLGAGSGYRKEGYHEYGLSLAGFRHLQLRIIHSSLLSLTP